MYSVPSFLRTVNDQKLHEWSHGPGNLILYVSVDYLLPSFFFPVPLSAAFIRVVGSEFVQKYLGEGPRMVRDVFRLARENAPSIIFIDEIDAIATKRFDAQTGGMSSCTQS